MMPTIGQIVHYVMQSSEHRPAIVVKAWADNSVNMHVFVDGSDGYPRNCPTMQLQRMRQSDMQEPGTWHEIEGEEVSGT